MATVHNEGLSEETKKQHEQHCDNLREKAIEALADRQSGTVEEETWKEVRFAGASATTSELLIES